MSHRFRFFGERVGEERWLVTGEELEHLRKVLRLSEGDEVDVTDGRGRWCVGEIQGLTKHEAMVTAREEHEESAPRCPLRIAVGALKPASLDEVLPMLVELGADEIAVFYQAETAKQRINDKVTARWDRILRNAAKQSKRAWLPELTVHESLTALTTAWGSEGASRFVLDPEGKVAMLEAAVGSGAVQAVVGGERGLDERELADLAAAGFVGVRLGRHILRAMTAVVAATACLSARRDLLS